MRYLYRRTVDDAEIERAVPPHGDERAARLPPPLPPPRRLLVGEPHIVDDDIDKLDRFKPPPFEFVVRPNPAAADMTTSLLGEISGASLKNSTIPSGIGRGTKAGSC